MSTINTGNAFNDEGEGKELETTVAEAQVNAPSTKVAREVESNALKEQEAAKEAASVAKKMGPDYTGEPSTAADKFKGEASKKTDEAVEEGKNDVHQAKITGEGYVEQAKAVMSSVIETAQSYLPESVGGKPSHTLTTSDQPGLVESMQSMTINAYNTVQNVAQPHIENVKGVAQGHMGTAGTQGAQVGNKEPPASSTDIPTTSAPLESGKDSAYSPYPSTTTTQGTHIGETEHN